LTDPKGISIFFISFARLIGTTKLRVREVAEMYFAADQVNYCMLNDAVRDKKLG